MRIPAAAPALLAPWLLLVVGALVGLPLTLEPGVATERLLGLVGAGLLGLLALWGLERLPDRHLPRVLAVLGAVALPAALWLIAAGGPGVLRGPIGAVLARPPAPLLGRISLPESVDVSNTRFIIGYNGLADVALVLVLAGLGVVLARPQRRIAIGTGSLMLVGSVVLLGTGARGGLAGLVVGLWVIAFLLMARRGWLLAAVTTLVTLGSAASGVLDKGLETSSVTGRLIFWGDLARLLLEYPLTGVGLGVATARQVIDFYEVNPDPERIAYAHNTFVQTYLEQGPLGTLGMLLVPVIAALAVLSVRRAALAPGRDGLARERREPAPERPGLASERRGPAPKRFGLAPKRFGLAPERSGPTAERHGQVAGHGGLSPERRALLLSSLALLVGLEVHGLTDQVLTTNGGTALLFLALAGVLGAAHPDLQRRVATWSIRLTLASGALVLVLALALLLGPGGRARVLLNLGNLELNRGLLGAATPDRQALSSAAGLLAAAVDQDATQPAAWRQLARARLANDDVAAAVDALQHAASRPDLDAFEMLQVAHVYRDLGFGQEAYAWATRAYAAWGRRPPDAVEVAYQRATLVLDPQGVLRTLTDQAEAALRAGRYAEAAALLRQALPLAPDNVYLRSRISFAERLQAREQR